jgi:drug/metabolite transporter (DMT)-like permease
MSRIQVLDRIPAPVLLLTAATLWGCSNVAQKTVLDNLGPLTALGMSSIVASAALYPLARNELTSAAGQARIPLKSYIAPIAVFVLALASLQIGFGGTSVSNAGFLVNSNIVLTPVAAWFILRETLGAGLIAPIALTVVGLGLITGGPSLTSLGWGDGLCLLASLFYSISTPLNCRYLKKSHRPALLSAIQFATCGILCLALGLAFEHNTAAGLLRAWPQIVFLGVIGKALPYFLMTHAQRSVGAGTTNLILSAEAPFGALAAFVLLGETMSVAALLGAILVIAGILACDLSFARSLVSGMLMHLNGGSDRAAIKDGCVLSA